MHHEPMVVAADCARNGCCDIGDCVAVPMDVGVDGGCVELRFNLMDEVYIQSDTLNLGVPVGEVGRVIMLDPRIYQAQPYLVRMPSKKEAWWMPECDLTPYAEWLEQNADTAIRETLVNHALDTGNRPLFDAVAVHKP